jgi:hypothetical protein
MQQQLPEETIDNVIALFLHPVEALLLKHTLAPFYRLTVPFAMDWLHNTKNHIDQLVQKDQLDLIQHSHAILSKVLKGSVHAIDIAAAVHGRLDMVQWLHQHRTDGATVLAIDKAACHGHLDVIQWLLQNRREGFTLNAVIGALRNKHKNIAMFLLDQNILPLDHIKKVYQYAWTIGDIELAEVILLRWKGISL